MTIGNFPLKKSIKRLLKNTPLLDLYHKVKDRTKKPSPAENRREELTKRYTSRHFNKPHLDFVLSLHEEIDFKGKSICDFGGSNIPPALMRELGAREYISIDTVSKWEETIGSRCGIVYGEIFRERVIYNKLPDTASAQDLYCILDVDGEIWQEKLQSRFDLVISANTFEHVNSISKCLSNIYGYLKQQAIFAFYYEPIFTSKYGHHTYIDDKIDFHTEKNLEYIHLKLDKLEAREYLSRYYDAGTLESIINQVYESSVINRKTFNDHILEIMNSPFNTYQINYYNILPNSDEIDKMLYLKYGRMRFDVSGIYGKMIKN